MPADVALSPPRQAQPGPLLEFWRSFRENRGAVIGLVIVIVICLVALFAPLLAPHSPIEQFRGFAKLPPAWVEGGDPRFLLGTDPLGRDMLSRILYGARISLFIGLSVMVVSAVVGVALGLWPPPLSAASSMSSSSASWTSSSPSRHWCSPFSSLR